MKEKVNRLYNDLVWIWPIISPHEDYVEESNLFSTVIKEHSQIEVKTLLHLGCGGGHNDFTFKKYFKVTGIDLSKNITSGLGVGYIDKLREYFFENLKEVTLLHP